MKTIIEGDKAQIINLCYLLKLWVEFISNIIYLKI